MKNKKDKLSASELRRNYLKILGEVGQILSDGKVSGTIFPQLLETIHREIDFSRSYIVTRSILDEAFQIKATQGFSATEFRRLAANIDKSFVSEVFKNSKAVILPRADLETTYLSNFIGSVNKNVEISGVCVPVVLQNKAVGVFGVEFIYTNKTDYEQTADFLSVVASMIAQAIKVEHITEKEKEKLYKENSYLKRELREKYDFGHIVGNSSAMKRVYDQVTQVARSNTTVLLRGESGTGKELIANAIHYNSLRAKKPFVKVNCAALPETLIESELFGYEKGAFTGATTKKKGRFEIADGGTLFLDEIGDLSAQIQIKLLRVLQEREFERVGGTETLKANVRLITATNKNLEEAIVEGSFREDLFYRLNVFTIYLPPLRERKSDILLLAESFVEKYEREHGKHIKRISTPAIDMLTSYHYPGNVRELENAVERAVLVCDGNVIHGHHLPPTLQTAEVTNTQMNLSLTSSVEAFERDLISDALKSTRGNRAKAAKMLDTTERILCYKISKYNIEPRRFSS
ncbi:MAG: sigma 54-interacting transcriptional regulator [Acidobacteriota bacterium]|nr:sigma 54-interacting transcriptional regulator [Acidobacteriota bacterium]